MLLLCGVPSCTKGGPGCVAWAPTYGLMYGLAGDAEPGGRAPPLQPLMALVRSLLLNPALAHSSVYAEYFSGIQTLQHGACSQYQSSMSAEVAAQTSGLRIWLSMRRKCVCSCGPDDACLCCCSSVCTVHRCLVCTVPGLAAAPAHAFDPHLPHCQAHRAQPRGARPGEGKVSGARAGSGGGALGPQGPGSLARHPRVLQVSGSLLQLRLLTVPSSPALVLAIAHVCCIQAI